MNAIEARKWAIEVVFNHNIKGDGAIRLADILAKYVITGELPKAE